MSEGHTPTRIRTAPLQGQVGIDGHLSLQCYANGDGGPACPACLALRLPAELPEHSWPWEPRIGPGAEPIPVSEDHR